MWSNEQVLQLIEDYHASSCLWDVTSTDYKNRVKRKLALESLAAKHEVTVADIEKTIHILKTSFNRERKKIYLSSGTSPKKSTWFAVDYLLFLLPANESKGSRNTDLDEANTESGNNEDEVSENSFIKFFVNIYCVYDLRRFILKVYVLGVLLPCFSASNNTLKTIKIY